MCKYCGSRGTTLIDSSIVDGEGIAISLNAGLGYLIIDTEYDSGCLREFMTIHVKYCPMCGCKL